MPITSDELKLYKAEDMTDGPTGGGRMSAHESVSGVRGNIFPDVFDAERTAGSTKYRKVFWKVADPENNPLLNVRVHMTKPTNGADYVTMFLGTQRNVLNELTGSEREYGVGRLAADVNAGQTSLTVEIEDASLAGIFQDGDTIWIGNGVMQEYHANVSVSVSGTTVTITLESGDMLLNDYSSSDTYVASVITVPEVSASWDNWSESSSTGTYDETTHPPEVNNIGTIEQTWTITFINSSQFTCEGDSVGAVGTGDISTDFAPNNPDFSVPYFVLKADGWGGTWNAGDTITFQTHPAAVPIWFKRVVPAGAPSVSNTFEHKITGESV